MIALLEKYSNAFGVAGSEGKIREIIKKEIKDHVDEVKTDFMGNLYAYKKCHDKNAPTVLLIAHMDEVGLMVTGAENSGLLKFSVVGGLDKRLLVSKRVVLGDKCLKGVIGAKPIHLQSRNEWKSPIPLSSLFIDVGTESKEEALKKVPLGTYGVFDTRFETQEDVAMGKAFDDRAGCAVVTELLQTEEDETYPVNIAAVFSVQEEVGLRGASIIAERVRPDYVLAFEGTTAGDVPGTEDSSPSTELRKGPAITFMDRTTIGFRVLREHLEKTAEKHGIPYQYKRTVTGGTDIGVIHTKGAIPSIVVSVPVRYIHSPKGILAVEDLKNSVKLTKSALMGFKEVL